MLRNKDVLVTRDFRGTRLGHPLLGHTTSQRICQNHLSAPLQRTPSQYTRSQCGGPAWPGKKALPF